MRKVLLLLLSSFCLGCILVYPIKRVKQQDPPMFALYLKENSNYKITAFRDTSNLISKNEIIDKLIGKKFGSCKYFVNFWEDILDLPVRKRQFVKGINHYYFVLEETTEEMLILDSNWNWNNVVGRRWIKK